MKHLSGILGILEENPEEFLQSGLTDEDRASIEQLIGERIQARSVRNSQRADQIREQLLKQGIELEYGAQGTTWRKIAQ